MSKVLDELAQVLEQRKSASSDSSYVASLHQAGLEKILDKVNEEAGETIEAQVLAELEKRFNISGLEEKASRKIEPNN